MTEPYSEQLLRANGKPANVFACLTCDEVWTTRQSADKCCNRRCPCGQPVQRYHTACATCIATAEAKREADRLEAADEVEYDGGMVWDGDYHETLDDFIEARLDEMEPGDSLPEFVYPCKSSGPALQLSMDCFEHRLDDAWKDASWEDFDGVGQLKAALEEFNRVNANRLAWEPDYSKKVRVPRADEAAEATGEES